MKASNQARTRPGGRTAATTRRVFAATLALLRRGGIDACTYQAVAQRADVARATLYRRWPEQTMLVTAAIADELERSVAPRPSRTFGGDLRALLAELATFLASPLGRASIVAAAQLPSDGATARSQFWQARLAAVTAMFDRAIARGELPHDVDREALLATAVGALYFRLLVMGTPNDARWLDRVMRATRLRAATSTASRPRK